MKAKKLINNSAEILEGGSEILIDVLKANINAFLKAI